MRDNLKDVKKKNIQNKMITKKTKRDNLDYN